MGRKPRVELAGGIHHVTERGNGKKTIFRDDRDRMRFLAELGVASQRHDWNLLAYCLMTNHVHLVIETPRTTLGDGMRQLAGTHARRFNKRYDKTGHLFEDRYWNGLVESDERFAQLLRYVALNPVKDGLCGDPSEWRWSNYLELLAGSGPGPRRVEELLACWGGEPGTRYERLFDANHVVARRFGMANPWTHRPPLQELLSGDDPNEAMRRAHENGYRFAEIGAAVGLHATTVSRRIARASR
jgi:REP element-mobilizing transposase RayT